MKSWVVGLAWVLLSTIVQAQPGGAPASQISNDRSVDVAAQSERTPERAGVGLAPSEGLKRAMMPFDQAKRQSDDLTDADRLALKVGGSRAAASCLRVTPEDVTAMPEPAELLALARLCLFGRQFPQAQKAATRYLQLDLAIGRRSARELLTQAFLGLHDTSNAAIQVRSLLNETSYDASLHTLLMQVVGAGALRRGDWMHLTLDLCAAEISHGFEAARHWQRLSGTG